MTFKIGDRVKYVGGNEPDTPRLVGKTGIIVEGPVDTVQFDDGELAKWLVSHNLTRIDEPALPVRTRTVTEIVPGEYNGILISEPGDYAVFIRMHIEDHGKFYDAAQLRAAARLFVSLAEALEETS